MNTNTGLSLLLTPPALAGPENAKNSAMQVQVLLVLEQNRLTNEEAGDFPEQWFYVVNTTKEIYHCTRTFVRVSGEYLGSEGTLRWAMVTWP